MSWLIKMVKMIEVSMIMKHNYGQMGFPVLHQTIYSGQPKYNEIKNEFSSKKMLNRGYKVYTAIIKEE